MLLGTLRVLILLSLFAVHQLLADDSTELEHKWSGLVDLRYTSTDSFESYPTGGVGKFRYSDGSGPSVAQAGVKYQLILDDWSFNWVGMAYLDDEKNKLGTTEAFVRYRGTPNESGYRQQVRIGFMYPQISMENIATAWASPYTLTYSTQNTWLGDEVRHVGLEWSLDRLGKNHNSDHDLNLTLSAFQYNDPTGSLLAWHGWTQSSRQTLWGEQMPFPIPPALLPGNMLETQAPVSDPFVELDSDFGYHIKFDWHWKRTLKVRIGHYDNQAADDIVKIGQYTWRTQFSHLGFEWRVASNTQVIGQYMQGDTRMRVANDFDVVGLDFTNSFVMVTQRINKHRWTARYEQFNNEDFDDIWGDNNDDQGDAFTISYQYRLDKGLYLAMEYNQINSLRPSRQYQSRPIVASESQWHTGLRYFF